MATWVTIHVKVNIPENVQSLFKAPVFHTAPPLMWVNLLQFFDTPILLEMGQGSIEPLLPSGLAILGGSISVLGVKRACLPLSPRMPSTQVV